MYTSDFPRRGGRDQSRQTPDPWDLQDEKYWQYFVPSPSHPCLGTSLTVFGHGLYIPALALVKCVQAARAGYCCLPRTPQTIHHAHTHVSADDSYISLGLPPWVRQWDLRDLFVFVLLTKYLRHDIFSLLPHLLTHIHIQVHASTVPAIETDAGSSLTTRTKHQTANAQADSPRPSSIKQARCQPGLEHQIDNELL